MKRWAYIKSNSVVLIIEQELEPDTLQDSGGFWREVDPSVGVGDEWDGQGAKKRKKWVLRTESFWDRFTFGERAALEVACIIDPTKSNSIQMTAARRLLRRRDIDKGASVNLKTNWIEAFVTGLETDGVLAAGRAATILTTPVEPSESSEN